MALSNFELWSSWRRRVVSCGLLLTFLFVFGSSLCQGSNASSVGCGNNGFYGYQCINECKCQNGGSCDPVTGQCTCQAGYTGNNCEHTLMTIYHYSENSHSTNTKHRNNMKKLITHCSAYNYLKGIHTQLYFDAPPCGSRICRIIQVQPINIYKTLFDKTIGPFSIVLPRITSGDTDSTMCFQWMMEDLQYHNPGTLRSVTSYCAYGSSCQRAMTCKQDDGGFSAPIRCTCPHGWHGDFCEMKDVCVTSNNPCKNGATCLPNKKTHFSCFCKPGTHGRLCNDADHICKVRSSAHDFTSARLFYYTPTHASKPLTATSLTDAVEICKRTGGDIPQFVPMWNMCPILRGAHFNRDHPDNSEHATGRAVICQRPAQICPNFGTFQVPKNHDFRVQVTFDVAEKLCYQTNLHTISWAFPQATACVNKFVSRLATLYGMAVPPKVWYWQDKDSIDKRSVVCWVSRSNEALAPGDGQHVSHSGLYSHSNLWNQ